MAHKIKMIGLDLDGTLLNSNKELTLYTKKVLEEAMEKGVIILAATGRPISGIPKEVLNLRGMKYAVTANGARVLDIESGEVLSENMIPVSVAEEALKLLEGYDTINEIFTEGIGYVSKNVECAYEFFANPSMAEYFIRTRKPVESTLETLIKIGKPVDKVQWIFRDLAEREKSLELLKTISDISITDALGNNWEVNKKGTNKGRAMVELGKKLGIQREEIMACGDGMNDFEMLKEVGFSVAMGNANEALKEIANYVTVSNDEDGVAKAIQKFVLEA